MVGPDDGALFSSCMASISDLDFDGVRELIVGALDATPSGPILGGALVYSGKTGRRLLAFQGETISGQFGASVAAAGDVDGDGLEDILIGAPSAIYQGQFLGAAYVFSGLDGHLIHRILGSPADPGHLGRGVAGLGDWDHDGFDDFLVSDTNDNVIPGASGVVRVYSGYDASVLMIIGAAGDSGIGGRLRTIQDVTTDGFPDVLVGVGGAVVLHSGADGSVVRRHLDQRPNDNFGSSLAGLGDLDQDGVEDYVIGAPAVSNNRIGHVYVYSGSSGALRFLIAGQEPGGEFGWAVAGPGDTDGDGYPDILVGALQDNQGSQGESGAAHLFSGFDGTHMASFHGNPPTAAYIGQSVSDAGDVNDDGLADFSIGSGSSINGGFANGVVRTYALHSYLNLFPRTLPAALGGTINFNLDFPDTDSGKQYVLLASGGVPGRSRVLDHWLPLARTPLLDLMLRNPPGFISGANGTLDAQGNAAAIATLAPNQAAAWTGRTIKFVAVSFDSHHDISLYSAAMTLTIEF
jgi:hypothetical protein